MAPVTTTTTTSCRPPPPTPPAPIIQVTRETLSSRAGAPVLKPIFSNQVLETNSFLFGNQFIPIGDQDQDQDPVLPLDDLFVYNQGGGQGGGTPLDSDLDLDLEEVPRLTVTWTRDLERRHTARQVEPGGTEAMWREGSNFLSKWIAIGCCEVHPAATPLSNWRRPRAAQWAPAEDC